MPDGLTSGLSLPVRGGAGVEVPLKMVAVSVSADTGLSNFDIRISTDDTFALVLPVLSIPHGYYLYDVGWRVTAAFQAGITVSLGDTDGASGWATAAGFGATVVDTELNWALGLTLASAEGVASTTATADTTAVAIYRGHGRTAVADTSGDRIALNATVSAADTTGAFEVYAIYAPGAIFRRGST